MKTLELEERMRGYESAMDLCVLPGVYSVARLDGRNFTRLTKEVHPFEVPFDPLFHDLMRRTAEHLMSESGIRVVYGFTQSDEISLLIPRDDRAFGRKLRKLHSILAGEASARFSLLLGTLAAFDCRVSQLPSSEDVIDYFRWRSEDAHRNALNAHAYWLLRKQGRTVKEATEALRGLSVAAKHDLLFQNGVHFNQLPAWQKRGCGLYWEAYERAGANPRTGEPVVSRRRRIRVDDELPRHDAYSTFLRQRILGTTEHLGP